VSTARDVVLGRLASILAGRGRPIPKRPGTTGPSAIRDEVPDAESLQELFVRRVEDYGAVVSRTDLGGLPAAVRSALGGARRVAAPPGLPPAWLVELTGLDVTVDDGGGDARGFDAFDGVVTGAALGIAETGTVVLDHGPDQGRRALSLLPDLQVCVLRSHRLVADVPDAVNRLSDAIRAGRPLTWISGPSATSDIELERVEGVHGPRRLRVVLVSEKPDL